MKIKKFNKKSYLNKELQRCPYCTIPFDFKIKYNGELYHEENESGDIIQEAGCVLCGKKWIETFKLIDIKEIK